MTRKATSRPHCWSRANTRQLLHLCMMHLCLSQGQTATLLFKHPQLLNYRAATLRQRVDYLQTHQLNVTRLVVKRPMILTYSVQTHLKPTIVCLQSLGSADWTGWRRMISSHPQLLTYNLSAILPPKLEKVTSNLQFSSRQDAIHMITSFPPIIWLQNDLLQTKMDFLTTELELSLEEMQFLVTSFPQVLGLSIKQNLQPKLQFLKLHLTMEQLKEFIAYQPSLLAYSLPNRIQPRIELLQENCISFAYSPQYLMSLTDVKFQQW